MVTSSWLRWLRSCFLSKGRTYRKAIARRPSLEHLEHRLAPATFIWTGGGGTMDNWSNKANWNLGVAPTGSTASLDDLVFPAGSVGSLKSNDDLQPVNGVLPTFNSITISGAGYSLTTTSPEGLALGDPSVYNSGYINVGSGLNNVSIAIPITIGGGSGSVQVFTVNIGSTLNLIDALSVPTGTTGAQITKEGAGTLVLSGDNSAYNGPIEIDQNAGVLQVSGNAAALGTGSVTVENNSQLQISGVTLPITNNLLLNGPGLNDQGALETVSGSSDLTGSITLDSNTTIGGVLGTTMKIDGVIGDLGSGHGLTKEGAGTVVLTAANTYHGGTTINNGILEIENAQALGAADGSPTTETVVNRTVTEAGTLQINGLNAPGGGFTIQNELLVLNGAGFGSIGGVGEGALENLDGNNVWHGDVVLGSPAPNGVPVSISVDAGSGENTSSLVIGVVNGDANSSVYFVSGSEPLTKIGTGTLTFSSDNIYTGNTTIAVGILAISDSHGLGKPSSATTVDNGATLELAIDNVPDSVTGTVNTLLVSNDLDITGLGENGVGALYNYSGINTYSGNILLFGRSYDGIGVEPDPNPKTDRTYFADDYHLMITGKITGGVNAEANIGTNPTLAKVDLGNLILKGANTQFFGATDIQEGWITAQNDDSLGGILSDVGDTVQPPTTVEYGASLMLEPPAQGSLTIPNRLILYGSGITQPSSAFPELIGTNDNGEGALLSLDGQNYVTGNIELGGAAGIGTQSIDVGYPTPGELFVDGPVSQIPPQIAVGGNGSGNEKETDIKGGNGIQVSSTSATLIINVNTFPDPDDIRVFLGGNKNTGTLVYDSSVASYPASAPTSANNCQISITYTPTTATLNFANENIAAPFGTGWNQNLVSGSQTMNFSKPLVSTYIQIVVNEVVGGVGNSDGSAAWTVNATVTPTNQSGSIVKLGSQLAVLQSPGTYTGGADVREGVLRVQNSSALGAAGNAGTVVEPGATLQLSSVDASDLVTTPYLNGGLPGGLDIWGTPLTVSGPGNDTLLPVDNSILADPLTLTPVQEDPMINLKGDNLWENGPITLDTSINLDVTPNSRLNLSSPIGDLYTSAGVGSNLTIDDTGELILAGDNTYHGVTTINQGIVTLENSNALGATDGLADTAAIVAQGAQLQLAGSIDVAGKMLMVQGQGTTVVNTPVIPDSWFSVGPAPVDNPLTTNETPTTGRITGVTVDPYDSKVIYVSTAGGGGWKSEDGGNTWQPMFDDVTDSSQPNSAAETFTGAIAVDPSNPAVIFLGTGNGNNSTDSYYGTGVYESIDSGRTWNLLLDTNQAPSLQNPFVGTAITKIVVDPNDPDSTLNSPVIYVSNSDQATNETAVNRGKVGVWRYDLNAPKQFGGPIWSDLTGIVSFARASSTATFDTPGPEDDYRIYYPNQDASYSDLAIAYDPTSSGGSGSILYFALGQSTGYPDLPFGYPNPKIGTPPPVPTNAVYRIPLNQEFYYTQFPKYARNYGEANLVSFIGNGFISDDPFNNYGLVINENSASSNEYPNPVEDPPITDNGNITIAVIPNTSAFPNPAGYVHMIPGNGQPLGDVFTSVTYATTAENVQPLNPNPVEGEDFQFVQSLDGGQTWKQVTEPATEFQQFQGFYDSGIAAQNPNTIFLGGAGSSTNLVTIYESTTDGASWSPIEANNGPSGDVHTMVYYPTSVNNGLVLVGTDGGLWSYNTATGLWSNLNGSIPGSDLDITQITSLAQPENEPGNFLAGTQSSSVIETSGSQQWTVTNDNTELAIGNQSYQYSGQVAVDPTNANNVYSILSNAQTQPVGGGGAFQTQAYLYASANGGLTWGTGPVYTVNGYQDPPLVLDQVDPARLLIGGSTLEQSVNYAALGSFINLNVPLASVTQIAVASYQGPFVGDPSFPLVTDLGQNTYDSGTIYVTNGKNVEVTKNDGVTWVGRTPPGLPGNVVISSITVDPTNRDHVYLTTSEATGSGGGRVYESTNAGQKWTNITANLPDLPTWTLVVDPRIETAANAVGNVYIGNDDGVWELPSGTAVWERVGNGNGMPNVQVDTLSLNQNTNILTAGTYGRGVFAYYLDDAVANSGGLAQVSGSSQWTGQVVLTGPTTIGSMGSQITQNNLTSAQLNLAGPISDAATVANPSNDSITKIGQGTVVFSGSNSFAGPAVVQDGVLIADNPSALGSPNQGTSVTAGASLELEADLNLEPVTLNGDGYLYNGHYAGAMRNISNNNLYTGQITLDTSSTIGVDSGTLLNLNDATADSIVDDGANYDVTKEGTGTLILSTANNFGGTATVTSGVLQVRNSGALGAFGMLGNETLVRDGAQLQLYSTEGGTPVDVSGEILSISGTGINGSGALLNVSGNNTWSAPIRLDINPNFSPSSLPSAEVAIGVANVADMLTLSGGTLSDGSLGAAGDANSVISGLSKVGPGTLTLDQADAFGGTTFVNQGVVDIQNGQALAAPADNQERQRVTVSSANPAGMFTLQFGGKVTPLIAVGTPATQVQTDLNALGTITGNASVVLNTIKFTDSTGNAETYYIYTVEFLNAFGLQNTLPLLIASPSGGAIASVSEVAKGNIGTLVTKGAELKVDGDPTSIGNGTGIAVAGETLGINGTGVSNGGAVENISGVNSWTGAVTLLTTNSTSATAVIDSMGSDGSSSLSFSGNVGDQNPLTTTAASLIKVGTGTVVFPNANTFGGNAFINNGDLDIQNPLSLGKNLPEIQDVSAFGTNGTYTLTFGTATTTTVPIAYNASALTMQMDLDNYLVSLNPLDTNAVTVTLAANVYTIEFTGTYLIGKNLSQLTASNFVNGASASVAVIANGTGSTTVNAGGTLQIDGDPSQLGAKIAVSNEALFLNGNGYLNAGALENISGNNSWLYSAASPNVITLGSNASIGTDGSTTLTDNQQIVDNGGRLDLTKVGTGTLDFDGSGTAFDNTYTGLTQVDQGTLQLDMTGGATPFQGDLAIGQPAPATGTATVQWLNNNQISSEAAATPPHQTTVSVNANGTMNLNGFVDTVPTLDVTDGLSSTGNGGQLTVDALNMTGGSVSLATSGSNLFLAGNVTATSDLGQTASILGPGSLSLNGSTRTFNVTSSHLQASDLLISAPIVNTSTEGIIKTGDGTLQLTADNASTFTGLTTIDQGSVQVDDTLNQVDINGGTLSGNGSVGDVDNGTSGGVPLGSIAPGDNGSGTPTGVLTITPNGIENWSSSTTFLVDLSDASNGPGAGYDQLDIDGSINLNGAKLNGTVSANINIGDEFTILQTTNGIISGNFAQPDGAGITFINGQKFDVMYENAAGGFTGAIVKVVLQREKDQLLNNTFTVTSSANPSVYGEDFTFTAALTPELGAGAIPTTDSVTFTLYTASAQVVATETVNVMYPAGDTTVGMATFDPQAYAGVVLDPGTYTLMVTYNGDTNFASTTVDLSGGQVVNPASSVINLSSTPANPVIGDPVTVDVSITARNPGVGTPQGTVTFTVDGSTGLPITLDSSGDASLTLPNLGAGTHRIDVSYSGDLDFNGNTTTTDFVINVAKDTDTFSLTATPAGPVYGQSVTFSAQVLSVGPDTDVPTGTVSFYDGNPSAGGKLLGVAGLDGSASASLTTSTLSVGSHVIYAVYSGDTEYLSNNTTINPLVVSPDTTNTVLSSSLNPSTFGNTITFTAAVSTVAPATGTPSGSVQFVIDGSNYGSPVTLNSQGQATLSVNNLTIKSHTIVAKYLGASSGIFGTSSSLTLNQVVRSGTSTKITSSTSPSFFGQSVTFTASVAAVSPGTGVPADGSIQFVIDNLNFGTPVMLNAQGQATITLNNLSISPTHTIVAQYSGDSTSWSPSNSSPLTQIVESGTTTTVTSSANPSVYGSQVTFTAVVGAGPVFGDIAPTGGGTITFKVDGVAQTPINLPANDTVSISLNSLGIGSHTIEADYSGTATGFYKSSGYVTQTNGTQTQVVDYNSTTTLTSSQNPVPLGSQVTFTATVAPVSPASDTPTGTVTFVIDGTPSTPQTLFNGSATFATSSLGFGSHTIVAIYNGNSEYVSSSAQITQNAVYSSSTNLSSAANPAVYGQPVAIKATVIPATTVPSGTPTPTGTVTFTINGIQQPAVALSSGVATLFFPTEPVGTYTILATYNGDQNFGSSVQSMPLSQQVNVDATSTTIASSQNPQGAGQSVTFTATVASKFPGTATPTGSVTFSIPGLPAQTVQLDGNGQATFTTNSLPMGANTIVANYNGSPNSGASSGSFTETILIASATSLTSSLNPSVFGDPVAFTASVGSVSGSGTPTGVVQFLVNGNNFGSPVPLNSSDVATLVTSTLAIGTDTVTAQYKGDGVFSGSSITISQTVLSATTTTLVSTANPAVYGQTASVVATVASVPPGAGTPSQGSVTFFINSSGQPAMQTTVPINASGQANLNLSTLSGGSYTITATYDGDNANYGPSTTVSSLSQTINPDGTTTTVTSSSANNTSGVGQSVTFAATVSPVLPGLATPTGSVTFSITGSAPVTVNLVNGVATLNHTFTTRGTDTVVATFNPSSTADFTSGTPGSLTQTVLNGTSTTLASSANPATPGTAVTFTATVKSVVSSNGTPTGSVAFYLDGSLLTSVPMTSGVAKLKLSTLTIGTHTITATYVPTTGNSFASSTATLTQQINYSATATLTSSENPAYVGDTILFTAKITPQNSAPASPTGTATLFVDGTAVQTQTLNPSATGTGPVSVVFTDSSLSAKTHSVYVVYNGDGNFATATSKTLSQKVQPLASRIVATVTPANGVGTNTPFTVSIVAYNAQNQVATRYTNQPVSISYTFTSPSGNGTIVGTLTGTMKNGRATLTGLEATKPGNYTLYIFAGSLEETVTITTSGRRS